MTTRRRKEYTDEALAEEKQKFLSEHSQNLEQLVRRYISSDVLPKATTGHFPSQSVFLQILNGMKPAVNRSFGKVHSIHRELCLHEVTNVCERIGEAFGLVEAERPTHWFSDLYKETHYSLRLFRFVLDEIKTILIRETGDRLLEYLLILTPAAIWARLRQYLDLPTYRDYGEIQTLAPTSVRRHAWVVRLASLDYTPIPDPLAVGGRLEVHEAANLGEAVERLQHVVESAEREVPELQYRLAHILTILSGPIAHARLSEGNAHRNYIQYLPRLAARAALRLRADGPFLTTSFLEEQIRAPHIHEMLSALADRDRSPDRERSPHPPPGDHTLSPEQRTRLPEDLQKLLNSLAPYHPAERRERRTIVFGGRV